MRALPLIRRSGFTIVLATIAWAGCANAALIDRGGGLIYDDALNITWLQNANYGAGSRYDDGVSNQDGLMTWPSAMSWASSLEYYDSVRNVTWTDWRLPTLRPLNGVAFDFLDGCTGNHDEGSSHPGVGWGLNNELGHLYYVSLGNTKGNTTCDIDDGPGLTNKGPFEGLFKWIYWQDVVYDADFIPAGEKWAWYFDMSRGHQDGGNQIFEWYSWAVRDGDVAAAAPEPSALALLGIALAGLGFGRRRR